MTAPPTPPSATLSTLAEVRAALVADTLVPPPAHASLGVGAMGRLRSEMARFSGNADHGDRRSAVERAINRLDPAAAGTAAASLVRARIQAGITDVDLLARAVPLEAVARAIGVPAEDLDAVATDVHAVVRAIGRSAAVTAEMDTCAQRLLDRFATHPDGAVAAVSVLYQTVDATAALVATLITQQRTGGVRPSALPGTVRAATATTTIGGVTIETGDQVSLRFTDVSQEFGGGRHECPGRLLAESIAAGIAEVCAEID
ncbi:MAG: hypothetical protein AAF467_00810 [Actinomycetota bacterium]